MSECTHERKVLAAGKCSDSAFFRLPDGAEREGYVPSGIGLGEGKYFEFEFCIDCGKIIGLASGDSILEVLERK